MTRRIAVREIGEREYAQWNDLIAKSPGGSIYSTPNYLDVFCSSAGGRFTLLAADREGELVGGIALCERDTRWGRYVGGRYLLYYNGFFTRQHPSKYPSERTARVVETLSALQDAVARRNYGRLSIRSRALPDIRVFKANGWRFEPSYTYVVPLTDLKEQWSRVEQNLRRLVTRCEREDIRFADDDDLESYLRLHLATSARKNIGAYLPSDAFRSYFKRLHAAGLCRLYHARLPDGRAISSQLVLTGMHAVSHTVSAAADVEYMRTGATAFLRWKSFESLAALGSTANDLTDAELNPVTHFKSQLGGDLELNFILARADGVGFAVERSLKQARSAASTLASKMRPQARERAQ